MPVRQMTLNMFSCLVVAICTAGITRAGEWPRFLGPAGTGVIDKGESVSRSWPGEGPKELWTAEVGEGYGGAAIAGGKVYLLDRKNDRDIFRVFDLKIGQTLWEHDYPAGGYKGSYPGSRSTPTIDGERAYTVGVMGHVHCFDLDNQKVLWSKSLPQDFGAVAGGWGYAQSPLVMSDKVVFSVAGSRNGLVALEKETGKTIWKSPAFGKDDTYTSPMLVTLAGQQQIVMWHKGAVAAVDPADGKVIWSYQWRTNRPIPQPVAMGDGRFFLTIGYGGGCTMIRVAKGENGTWKVTEEFQDGRSSSKIPPAMMFAGHIYANSDDNKKGLQCLDLDGNVKWETGRAPGFGSGSLIIVDGVIFIVSGESGELVMAEANPAGYKELGRAKVLGGRDLFAPLAFSDGMLILRDGSQMKCLQVGAKPASARAGGE